MQFPLNFSLLSIFIFSFADFMDYKFRTLLRESCLNDGNGGGYFKKEINNFVSLGNWEKLFISAPSNNRIIITLNQEYGKMKNRFSLIILTLVRALNRTCHV